MTRDQAAKIAKDLIEGGINANGTTRITAQAHGVSIGEVRRIRRNIMRMGSDMMVSMVEAIFNGWEDEALNLKR